MASALQAGRRDTLDEVALQEQEDDGDRDQGAQRRGHDQVVIGGVRLDEAAQADLDGLVEIAGQVDQGAHVVVPGVDERKDAQRRDGGLGQRQHDARPDAVLAQAVDTGRLAQLVGDAQVELAHQEHAERGKRLEHHQRPQRVVQADVAHHDELRHHVDLPRHRDGADVAHEQQVASLELHLRKGVRCEGGGQNLHEGDDNRDDGGVLKVREQRHLLPDFHVVFEAEGFGNPVHGDGEHVRARLERGGNHPHERNQGDDQEKDQERVEHDAADDLSGRQRSGRLFLGSYSSHVSFLLSYM